LALGADLQAVRAWNKFIQWFNGDKVANSAKMMLG
jgi:hypothetical protein